MIPKWTIDKEPHIRTSETNHWYRMIRNGEITEVEFFDVLNDAMERTVHRAPTAAPAQGWRFDFHSHLARQREFSERTFGPGKRTNGIIDHIRKELKEIEKDPDDATEWIDVVILALDGAWRIGLTPDQIIRCLVNKQDKNEAREWPDWKTADPDKDIQHVRRVALAAPDGLVEAARPRVVCLCGSTRFKDEFVNANLRETLAGKIVLSIGCDMRTDDEIFGHMTPDELNKTKTALDELHKRKIDLSDEVLILNVGGYIGNSTRSELAYAIQHNKAVRWLEPDSAALAAAQPSAQESEK